MSKGLTGPRIHLTRRLHVDGKTVIMCRCSDYVPIKGTVREQEAAHREHRRAMGENVAEPAKPRDVVLKELRDRVEELEAAQRYETSCTSCASNLFAKDVAEDKTQQVQAVAEKATSIVRGIEKLCNDAEKAYDATPDWVRRVRMVIKEAGNQ